MVIYTVTSELETPWHKKLIRWLKIIKKREEFEIAFTRDFYSVGDIIQDGVSESKILTKRWV